MSSVPKTNTGNFIEGLLWKFCNIFSTKEKEQPFFFFGYWLALKPHTATYEEGFKAVRPVKLRWNQLLQHFSGT